LNIFCYQVYRCRESVDFSLQCAWLLDAYSSDASLPTQKKSHGTKLKNLILSDELRPNTTASSSAAGNAVKSMKGHQHHTVVKITPLPTVTGHQGKENLSHLSIQVSPEGHLKSFFGKLFLILICLICRLPKRRINAHEVMQRSS